MTGTKFVLPKFIDADYCKITKYEVSSSNTTVTYPGGIFVSDPTSFTSDIAYK
jgi:hypothetical protein